MYNINEIAAVFILRVFLGILFIAQGYDKVFKITIKGVYETFEVPMRPKKIPHFLLKLSAYLTSYIELIGGICLILGLFKFFVLYMLGFDLILVSIAMSMLNPMWDMQYVFPRMVILIVLLIIPPSWDLISIDNFLLK